MIPSFKFFRYDKSVDVTFRMVLENIPDLSKLVGRLGSSPGVGSVATCPFTSIPGRIRAAAECVMVFQLVYKYRQDLAEKDLEENFLKVNSFI